MPPAPQESLFGALKTLSLNKLDSYVKSSAPGAPLEKSPTLKSFEARKATYVKEGAWNAESKRIWTDHPQFAVDAKGEHITSDKGTSISRIHSLTLIQIAEDLGEKNLSPAEIQAAIKVADKIKGLAESPELRFTNGRADADLTSFVRDCLKEAGWEQIAAENKEQVQTRQLYMAWRDHILKLVPDFDTKKMETELDKVREKLAPLVKTIWKEVQSDKDAFLYKNVPTTPIETWLAYPMDRLTSKLANTDITPKELARTKTIVVITNALLHTQRIADIQKQQILENMIALSIALQRKINPETNELVIFIEQCYRRDLPFDLDLFDYAAKGFPKDFQLNLGGVSLDYLQKHHPKIPELSAQALVWGAAAQAIIDKIFAGIDIEKPYPVELLGGFISNIGTKDVYAKHRNFGTLQSKTYLLKHYMTQKGAR